MSPRQKSCLVQYTLHIVDDVHIEVRFSNVRQYFQQSEHDIDRRNVSKV